MMRRLALLFTVLTLVLVGCGSDDDSDEAQPNPDDAQFSEGVFDDIPLMPTSEEISERTEREGVVSQSFTIRGDTPLGVMEWYEDSLAGEWTNVTPATETGVDSYRSRWSAQERVLTIRLAAGAGRGRRRAGRWRGRHHPVQPVAQPRGRGVRPRLHAGRRRRRRVSGPAGS